MAATLTAVKDELQKGHKVLETLLNNSGGVIETEKRTLKSLPALDDKNFYVWFSRLQATLEPYNLWRYLDGELEVPEPRDKSSAEWATWRADRRQIFELITASITDPVWSRMRRVGWDPEHGDPCATYASIFGALQGCSENMNRLRTLDFFTLRLESFNTIDGYLDRVCALREELSRDGVENNIKTEMYTVLSAIKDKYPQVFDRNMRKLEESVAAEQPLDWRAFIQNVTVDCAEEDYERLVCARLG